MRKNPQTLEGIHRLPACRHTSDGSAFGEGDLPHLGLAHLYLKNFRCKSEDEETCWLSATAPPRPPCAASTPPSPPVHQTSCRWGAGCCRLAFTRPTLATDLGVSLSTLYSWNSSVYAPPFVKLGNLVRYTDENVELWLARQLELSRG